MSVRRFYVGASCREQAARAAASIAFPDPRLAEELSQGWVSEAEQRAVNARTTVRFVRSRPDAAFPGWEQHLFEAVVS